MIYKLKSGETKFFRIEVSLCDRLQDFVSQKAVIFKIVKVRIV